MAHVLLGKVLLEPLCAALGIEFSHVRRIVLDVSFDAVVIAYIEQFGDERLLKIDWPGNLADAKITYDKPPRKDDTDGS